MKSAYEIAMERLEKKAPSQPLTDDQKARIAEIDEIFRAKIAEREIFLTGKIVAADQGGDHVASAELRDELRRDLARLKEDAEQKKAAVRAS